MAPGQAARRSVLLPSPSAAGAIKIARLSDELIIGRSGAG